MHTRRTAGGYSLYELIGTIGLVALVMSLGVPSFGRILAEHRLRADVATLFHAIHLARKESVFRRREVTLCPSPDGEQCVPGFDWSEGFVMFVNLDRDSPVARDPEEPLLMRYATSSHNQITANRSSFSFRTTALRATNGTFILCNKTTRSKVRALIVSYTGRPRVSRFERNGKPRRCLGYVKLTPRL